MVGRRTELNQNSPGFQEPGRKWQDSGTRTTHTHTPRRTLIPKFNAKWRQAGRKEAGGWGAELLRATLESKGCLRNCESEKVPDSSLHPQVWALLPATRFQRGSELGEKSCNRASLRLPSPAWPRARNPDPLKPWLGEAAGQRATSQRVWGRRRASCTLWPGCSFLPLSTHTPVTLNITHTLTHKHTHTARETRTRSPLPPFQVHRLKH